MVSTGHYNCAQSVTFVIIVLFGFAPTLHCSVTFPLINYVVPENIHTQPMDGHCEFQGGRGGGSQRPRFLKESMKLNWNFQSGGGVQN